MKYMNHNSIKIGVGFGLASGVLTTLGLMIGLFASTNSRGIILAGIFTIAIADSCSDGLGIHFSEESKRDSSTKDVWVSTFCTFISKLIVTLSFLPLFFIFTLNMAIIANIIWGFLLLSAFSYKMAVDRKNSPVKVIFEHVFITLIVVVSTYYLGRLIDRFFSILLNKFFAVTKAH